MGHSLDKLEALTRLSDFVVTTACFVLSGILLISALVYLVRWKNRKISVRLLVASGIAILAGMECHMLFSWLESEVKTTNRTSCWF